MGPESTAGVYRTMSLRTALLLAPLVALPIGCASRLPADPPREAQAALPPIPYCHDEMNAFIELNRFARAHGDGWTLFAPAIDALQRKVVDCVDDAAERLHLLRLNPAPPVAPPAGCGADCPPLRSAAVRTVRPAG
jgi:hypothetical protein